jgi:uncharacterized protein YodC (DUF2158 family)
LQFWLRLILSQRMSLNLSLSLRLRLKSDCDEWFGSFETITTKKLKYVRDFDYFEHSVIKCKWFDLLPFWLRLRLSQRVILDFKLKCDSKQRCGCRKAITPRNLTIVWDFDYFENSVVECKWFDLLRFWLILTLRLRVILDLKLKSDYDEWFVCCEALITKNLNVVWDFENGVVECKWVDLLLLIDTESESDFGLQIEKWLWWMICMLWSTHRKEFECCLRFWLFWKQRRQIGMILFIAILIEIESESESEIDLEIEVEMWFWWMIWMLWSTGSIVLRALSWFWLFWKQRGEM